MAFEASPDDVLLSMVLAVPRLPTPAFGGLLIGQAVHAGTARPICGRVLMVRMRDPIAAPDAGNGYLNPGSPAIAEDLAAIGYASADCGDIARSIVDFLAAPSGGQVEMSPQAVEEIALPLALAQSGARDLTAAT